MWRKKKKPRENTAYSALLVGIFSHAREYFAGKSESTMDA
jgi:hypothetical protein